MLFIEILLIYIFFTISTLLVLCIARNKELSFGEYLDNHIVLLKILNRWINYYLFFKKIVKIHRVDYINTITYLSILIVLCYLTVIVKYGL